MNADDSKMNETGSIGLGFDVLDSRLSQMAVIVMQMRRAVLGLRL